MPGSAFKLVDPHGDVRFPVFAVIGSLGTDFERYENPLDPSLFWQDIGKTVLYKAGSRPQDLSVNPFRQEKGLRRIKDANERLIGANSASGMNFTIIKFALIY